MSYNLTMDTKKTIIKAFLTRYNRDCGTDNEMPDHIWHRWYGIDGRFYKAIWKKLNADQDLFIFDDFCDIAFDLNNGNKDSLKNLTGTRLTNLFRFSWRMLVHYQVVTFFWKITETMIQASYWISR